MISDATFDTNLDKLRDTEFGRRNRELYDINIPVLEEYLASQLVFSVDLDDYDARIEKPKFK